MGFAVSKRVASAVIRFEALGERLCIIRFKGLFKNISTVPTPVGKNIFSVVWNWPLSQPKTKLSTAHLWTGCQRVMVRLSVSSRLSLQFSTGRSICRNLQSMLSTSFKHKYVPTFQKYRDRRTVNGANFKLKVIIRSDMMCINHALWSADKTKG